MATWLLVCNVIFHLNSLCKEHILTNQMKNEYFQENLENRIKITMEMILSEVPNEIYERESKSQSKRRFFGTLFCLITSKTFSFPYDTGEALAFSL